MSWTISAASSMLSQRTWTLIAESSFETKMNKGMPALGQNEESSDKTPSTGAGELPFELEVERTFPQTETKFILNLS